VAGVDLLQHAGGGRGAGRRGSAGQAEAQQKFFALFLDLQGLQDPRAGLIEGRLDVRQTGVGFGGGAERGQGRVQLVGQGPLTLQQVRVRRPAILLQEPILLQRELVELVADPLVLLQRFQESHESWTSRKW